MRAAAASTKETDRPGIRYGFHAETRAARVLAWVVRDAPRGRSREAPHGEPRKPRLGERVHLAIRARHLNLKTQKAYWGWIRRFIFFHGVCHPDAMGEVEVNAFLTHLATENKVSASTQNQALGALLFLYKDVLGRELGQLAGVVRAKRPVRLPIVLTAQEVRAVLGRLCGTPWLMASLLYGAGLRLMECCRLRVQDVDFGRGEIVVRDGKGRKDRVTLLPACVREPLAAHLAGVRRQHLADLARGGGAVQLPGAIRRKYPNAPR